jgi:4a-hydroxytetrahydrobiopterin dehydratase
MSALTQQDRLERAEIENRLQGLPNWSLGSDGLKLKRTLIFEDFVSAFAFMTQSALIAERIDHHPEWINVWSRVEIALTTHTAKGITARDIELAKRLDAIASRYPLQCGIGGEECGGCG